MAKYWELIGHYTGEAQTYEALSGAFQASGFSPLVRGRLIGLRVMVGGEAATSLVEGIEFRLTCATWNPNSITIGAQGNGLRTVPTSGQQGTPIDFEIDQPVEPGTPIAIEGRHTVATAVTCNCFIFGLFTTSG